MKVLTCAVLASLLLIAVTAKSDQCDFIRVETIVIAGGQEWHHEYFEWFCYEGGGGPGGGSGTGGSGYPHPPIVRIVSASDEDPNQVELRFDYDTGGGIPTSMTLKKNGQVVSSGPPSTFGLYGSLDNMVYDSTLTVSMCNDDGCGEDFADVSRSTQRPQAEGAVSAQWADYIYTDIFGSPPIGVRVGYESYTRILEVEVFTASYSVPTSGARNGRAKHVQTTDSLLWEDGKRLPAWIAAYQMIPSWGGYQTVDFASAGAGCYLPQNRFPNQSAMCTTPGEFGRDGTPGAGSIQTIVASGSADQILPLPSVR